MNLLEIRDRLLKRAAALSIQGDTEEATLDALLDCEVQVEAPTDAECRAYYAQHPLQFRSGSVYEADHILFAVTGAVPIAALKAKAEEVLQAVLAAPELLGAMAAQYSNCPSGALGGNLGQLASDSVVPEFWQALEEFGTTGVVPRLVETRFGLHIVRVVRHAAGKMLPFEVVRAQIEPHLAQRKLRQALRDYAHARVHEALGHEPRAHPH